MSYTVATENKKLGKEIQSHEQRIQDQKLSGKQEGIKIQNAQDILKNLQVILTEGEIPGTEVLNDVLLKTEQFLMKQAQTTNVDPQTRKTLEDIALLVGSAKQMARNKDLGDRLQRIADETAAAIKGINATGVSEKTRDASFEILNIVQNWRPVFELLVSSREFRVLIVDTTKILRKILNRHQKEGLGDKVKEKFVSGVPLKEIGQTVKEDTKETFKTPQGDTQVRVSDEEFDTIYEDIVHILVILSRTPHYKEGIERLFNLFDILRSQTRDSSVKSASLDLHAKRAQLEAKELITSFTGREPLDNFIDSLKRLIQKMDAEVKTRQYFTDLRNFILDSKTGETLNERETKEKLKKFIRDGREIVQQFKYGDEVDNFFNAADQLLESIKNDEFVNILRHHAGFVADDLSFVDNSGNVQLDTEILGKLRGVLAPVIAESLKYIPIPKIEDNNDDRHFWVDNVVLCGYDVIPDKIRVQMESDSKINIREIQTDHSDTSIVITLKNIRTEIKNLDFFYNKKTFPQLTEQGRVTLRLPGDGATLILKYFVQQSVGQAVPLFHRGKVDFQIHDFELEFDKKTLSHDILVPMLTSMFKYQLQRQIELSVERNLGGLVNSIGEKLSGALVEVNRPLIMGMENVKKAVKSSDVGTVFEKRREKLE